MPLDQSGSKETDGPPPLQCSTPWKPRSGFWHLPPVCALPSVHFLSPHDPVTEVSVGAVPRGELAISPLLRSFVGVLLPSFLLPTQLGTTPEGGCQWWWWRWQGRSCMLLLLAFLLNFFLSLPGSYSSRGKNKEAVPIHKDCNPYCLLTLTDCAVSSESGTLV